MYIDSYKKLIVWQKSIELVKEVYRITNQLPKYELYGLSAQMRKSAVSIPSNIAEGNKRKTKNDYIQFLRIASGSAAELETQLIISSELYDVKIDECITTLEEVQKMLSTIIKKLEDNA